MPDSFSISLPLLLAVRPDGRLAGNRFTEVRVNGRTGDGLDALQLTRCRHVELLDEVIDDAHEGNHDHEPRRGVRDDD